MLPARIRLVLAAACVGDALGAATEGMFHGDIAQVFGGEVTQLVPPPALSPFAKGLEPGKLTDDATQMLAMASIVVRAGGAPNIDDAVDGLLLWMSDEEIFSRFAGPTTRVALERLRAGTPAREVADPGYYSCVFGTSNGAAMRAPIAGCIRPGNPAAAALVACVLAAPTHNTRIAYAGAGAVAGAISHGLGGGARRDLLAAALDAAAAGAAEAGRSGRVTGGPDVGRRIEMAAAIGATHAGRPQAAMTELEAVIGNGVAMAEAVPAAFGLVLAAEFSPWRAILAAVNGGNDSDTIAMIAGAIAAAYGTDDLDAAAVETVERVNGLRLGETATRLAGIAHG